ncbi:MAG: P27 family phage terminase small subunit [Iamia sp.]
MTTGALQAVPDGPGEVPAAPDHLARAAGLWADVARTYSLDAWQYELLRRCCEAGDRADEAREQIAADGLTTTDRYGQVKPHPAVNIERDARLSQARLLRDLRLEDEPQEPRVARGGRRR